MSEVCRNLGEGLRRKVLSLAIALRGEEVKGSLDLNKAGKPELVKAVVRSFQRLIQRVMTPFAGSRRIVPRVAELLSLCLNSQIVVIRIALRIDSPCRGEFV